MYRPVLWVLATWPTEGGVGGGGVDVGLTTTNTAAGGDSGAVAVAVEKGVAVSTAIGDGVSVGRNALVAVGEAGWIVLVKVGASVEAAIVAPRVGSEGKVGLASGCDCAWA